MSAFDCRALDERLLDFLYGELLPQEVAELEAHLAGCARCAAEVASFRRVRQAASALTVEEPRPDSLARLLAEATAAVSTAGTPKLRLVAAAPAVEVSAPRLAAAAPVPRAEAIEPIAHAAVARRRAWWSRPAWAAAASFVVVGLGTAWFLRVNPVAVRSSAPAIAEQAPMEAPSGARDEALLAQAPAPATPPQATAAAAPTSAPTELDKHVYRERERADSDSFVAKKRHEPLQRRLAKGAVSRAVSSMDLPDDSFGGLESGRGGGAGGSIGRAPAAPPRLASAPAREPSGHGAWLDEDENPQLARSVLPPSPLAGAPAAKAASAAPKKKIKSSAASEGAIDDLAKLREALAAGRCTDAADAYRSVRTHAPDRLGAAEREGVARCLVRLGRYDEAEHELRALADKTPSLRDEVDHQIADINARRQRPQAAPAEAAAPH